MLPEDDSWKEYEIGLPSEYMFEAKDPPTQLMQALHLVNSLKRHVSQEKIKALQEIVGIAQNAPPEGGSDGSISNPQWYAFREVHRAAQSFLYALELAEPK